MATVIKISFDKLSNMRDRIATLEERYKEDTLEIGAIIDELPKCWEGESLDRFINTLSETRQLSATTSNVLTEMKKVIDYVIAEYSAYEQQVAEDLLNSPIDE